MWPAPHARHTDGLPAFNHVLMLNPYTSTPGSNPSFYLLLHVVRSALQCDNKYKHLKIYILISKCCHIAYWFYNPIQISVYRHNWLPKGILQWQLKPHWLQFISLSIKCLKNTKIMFEKLQSRHNCYSPQFVMYGHAHMLPLFSPLFSASLCSILFTLYHSLHRPCACANLLASSLRRGTAKEGVMTEACLKGKLPQRALH